MSADDVTEADQFLIDNPDVMVWLDGFGSGAMSTMTQAGVPVPLAELRVRAMSDELLARPAALNQIRDAITLRKLGGIDCAGHVEEVKAE